MSQYAENKDGRSWWCNTHRRWATFVFRRELVDRIQIEHCCKPPGLGGPGGIMIPCSCVDVTDEVEIDGAQTA